jgi:hypothetical protein
MTFPTPGPPIFVPIGAPEALNETRMPMPFGMASAPAPSVPMAFRVITVPSEPALTTSTPVMPLPTITFASIVVVGELLMWMPYCELPMTTVPLASVPNRLFLTTVPDVWEVPIVIPMPLPEMTLPAAAVSPPITLFVVPVLPVSMKMPFPPLPSGATPNALRPIQLPWITLLVPPCRSRPALVLPERRFRSAGAVPPIVQLEQPTHAMP